MASKEKRVMNMGGVGIIISKTKGLWPEGDRELRTWIVSVDLQVKLLRQKDVE